MAKGNLILGTMAGKLGDVVAYNYNGKQAARVRRRQISNPKTSKQAIQRAIAATVAKFVSAFAPVLNNSLQSESTKVKTLAKIRSLNMSMLRQLAAQNLGTYAEKGSIFVAPNNYIISRGTLAGLSPLSSEAAVAKLLAGQLCFDPDQIDVTGTTTATASQAFPSIAVGDQITFLASTTEDVAEGSISGYCRFAFKDNTTPVFIENTGGNGYLLNPAAIDTAKAEGPWQSLIFESSEVGDDDAVLVTLSGVVNNITVGVLLAGVIVSREAGKMRSNATMLSSADEDYSLANVYPTYTDGGTPIDMPSELYLNNDANAQG